jgi:hypothetical protein
MAFVRRDPSWSGFLKGAETVGKDALKVGETVAPLALSLARREPESGWDKFENGVETVGKDAWGAVQEVAPLVAPIAQIAGKVA